LTEALAVVPVETGVTSEGTEKPVVRVLGVVGAALLLLPPPPQDTTPPMRATATRETVQAYFMGTSLDRWVEGGQRRSAALGGEACLADERACGSFPPLSLAMPGFFTGESDTRVAPERGVRVISSDRIRIS
jgi:hypothetical protein